MFPPNLINTLLQNDTSRFLFRFFERAFVSSVRIDPRFGGFRSNVLFHQLFCGLLEAFRDLRVSYFVDPRFVCLLTNLSSRNKLKFTRSHSHVQNTFNINIFDAIFVSLPANGFKYELSSFSFYKV